jgi:hypothetical protein
MPGSNVVKVYPSQFSGDASPEEAKGLEMMLRGAGCPVVSVTVERDHNNAFALGPTFVITLGAGYSMHRRAQELLFEMLSRWGEARRLLPE